MPKPSAGYGCKIVSISMTTKTSVIAAIKLEIR